jgi:hypothetical protein
MTTTCQTTKPLSTARAISYPLALASLIFMGSTCAAHAATVEDYSRMINGSCDYPDMCTGNNISSPMQYMQLAQQEDAGIVASPDQEANSAPAENSQVGYPTMLWEDTKHVLGAPARWDDQEWKDMGWTALGVLGVMAVLDRPVQDAMRRIAPDDDQLTPNDNLFLLEIERFGREYSLGLLGGFYVVGALSDDETAIAVAQDGLTSVILASGVITSAIKIATGRARPRQDLGAADFNPLGGNDSFPSGHATHAFAIASVIANHYDETWITYSSYGVASLVGLARSYHGGHFASDILAGGIIGTMVGKSVVEYNKPMRANKMVLMPEVAPGTVGIRMVSSF